MMEIVDRESAWETKAKEKVLEAVNQKPGQTTEEISKTTGLTEDMVCLSLSRLHRDGLTACRARSHCPGIRAEYFPI